MITGSRRIKDLIKNRANGDSGKSQMLLRHFSMERLLERLSLSPYADDFIIKGGMLISSLVGVDERMTRDIDATIRGHDLTLEEVGRILGQVASMDIGDGFEFSLGEPISIMEDAEYGGVRVPVKASIERTQTVFKIDVSTGDALTPSDVAYDYKLMFEDRSIALRSYNVETALAEKLETILALSLQTTRMRDFYDVYALMNSGRDIDYLLLREAIEATVAVRESAASLQDASGVMALLFSSTEMPLLWERYQAANAFAQDISWKDALDALSRMFGEIEAQGLDRER